jgi:hypothetical protein
VLQVRRRSFVVVLWLTSVLTVGLAQAAPIREQNLSLASIDAQPIPVLSASSVQVIPEEPAFLPAKEKELDDSTNPIWMLDPTQVHADDASTQDRSQRVPEPRSLALFGSGLLLLALVLRTSPMPRVGSRIQRRQRGPVPSALARECPLPSRIAA